MPCVDRIFYSLGLEKLNCDQTGYSSGGVNSSLISQIRNNYLQEEKQKKNEQICIGNSGGKHTDSHICIIYSNLNMLENDQKIAI